MVLLGVENHHSHAPRLVDAGKQRVEILHSDDHVCVPTYSQFTDASLRSGHYLSRNPSSSTIRSLYTLSVTSWPTNLDGGPASMKPIPTLRHFCLLVRYSLRHGGAQRNAMPVTHQLLSQREKREDVAERGNGEQ